MSAMHPFDPLSPAEITRVAAIVRAHFPGQAPAFRFITLKEPAKQEMLPFLESEHKGLPATARPARLSRVQIVLRGENGANKLIELQVDLDSKQVVKSEHLVGRHSYIDPEYMKLVESACLADSRVQEEIKKLKLPPSSTVVVEPWAYGTDGVNDMSERVSMVSLLQFIMFRC